MPDRADTNVYVDMSLFTKDNSFGHINGEMRFPSIPSVGEVVPFNHPESDGADELIGAVRIEAMNYVDGMPALFLSDVHVGTKDDAFRVSRFLERRFGLFANIHDEDDLTAYMQQDRETRGN